MENKILRIVTVASGVVFLITALFYVLSPYWIHGDDQLGVLVIGIVIGIPSLILFILALFLTHRASKVPITKTNSPDRIACIVAIIIFLSIISIILLGVVFHINVLGIACDKFCRN